MNINGFIFNILKKVWIIVLLVCLSAISSYYYSLNILNPIYESGVSFYVLSSEQLDKKQLSYDDIMVSKQLVKDYKEFMTSKSVIENVISDLQISNISIDDFGKKISVVLINNTNIMVLKVKDDSPIIANKYAEKLSEVFIKKVSELTKGNSISIMDNATLPTKAININIKLNIILASIIAFIISTSLIIGFEITDDKIKTSRELEERYGAKILGTIPYFKTSKYKEVR